MSELAVYEQDESIIDLSLQGMNATQIAKKTGVQRKVVIQLLKKYQEIAKEDQESRDLARIALAKMVAHYDKLIRESYELLENLKNEPFSHQIAAQINTTLKNLSEYEAKRVDALQKAGFLENQDLGDELARMEEEKQIVLGILRNDLCRECRPKVIQKIGEMSGRVEVVVVE